MSVKRIFILSSLLVLAACGKKEPVQNAEPAPAPSAASAPATGAGAASTEAPIEVDRTATINKLTQTLRRYAAEKQRVPTDLQELVTAGYLTDIPEAPAGKKYTFNPNLQVSLQNK